MENERPSESGFYWGQVVGDSMWDIGYFHVSDDGDEYDWFQTAYSQEYYGFTDLYGDENGDGVTIKIGDVVFGRQNPAFNANSVAQSRAEALSSKSENQLSCPAWWMGDNVLHTHLCRFGADEQHDEHECDCGAKRP